ncbi:MAG: phosphodiesterase [Desulfococcaceae bacterium]
MILAQISDLHITSTGEPAYGVADTVGRLADTVTDLNRLDPRPEAVIVTGDVSDEGGERSYAQAAEILEGLEIPFFLIPGNHDRKKHLVSAFPGHDYLSAGIPSEEGDTFLFYAVERFPLRLVGLDSVTPGEHGGGLCSQRLEWLDQTLGARPEAPTLVFLHHPPFASGIAHMDGEVFRNFDLLDASVRKHPQVLRLTCGHIHRFFARMFGGTVATVSPGIGMRLPLDLRPESPSCFEMSPPAYLLHVFRSGWDGTPELLTHVRVVGEGNPKNIFPFFDVVSPE